MKNLLINKFLILNDPRLKVVFMLMLFITLILVSNHLAAQDLLVNTDKDVADTMKGTGKKWILWIDGAISLGAFLYTKKPTVFFSVLAVCLFISALIKLATGS